ncbi:MAG: pyridoxamine 5'-phosphate oxidase family protein [Anaerolineae bacterium]|nr:pyridoxamine 5'-phosphate oxidase family protein [Anaerolineae bacterium]
MDRIPDDFRDLIDGPVVVLLTTLMPDGQPQTTPVWCDAEGDLIRINTMSCFRKARNMRLNPKVTLLAYQPERTGRFLEVRGEVVEMTEDGALAHLDGLSMLYTGRAPYFGEIIPAHYAETEIPVLVRIKPLRVIANDF